MICRLNQDKECGYPLQNHNDSFCALCIKSQILSEFTKLVRETRMLRVTK